MFYRKMCIRYNGAISGEQPIHGGGPQGGLLTVLLFDLQFNLAGYPCPILSLLPPGVKGPENDPDLAGPLPLCHTTESFRRNRLMTYLYFNQFAFS